MSVADSQVVDSGFFLLGEYSLNFCLLSVFEEEGISGMKISCRDPSSKRGICRNFVIALNVLGGRTFIEVVTCAHPEGVVVGGVDFFPANLNFDDGAIEFMGKRLSYFLQRPLTGLHVEGPNPISFPYCLDGLKSIGS